MTFQQRLVLVDECSAAFLAIFTTKAVFVRVRAGLEITLGQIGRDRILTISFTDYTVISALRAIRSL